jgi:hypothetical protein
MTPPEQERRAARSAAARAAWRTRRERALAPHSRMPRMSTQQLTAIFERLMAQRGTPVQRIPDERAVVYQLPDGKTVRLRTNNLPVLVAPKNEAGRFAFEANDFVAIVIALRGKIHVYVIPSEVVARTLRDDRQRWLAESPTHNDNLTPVLRFDGRPDNNGHGYAEEWHHYHVGEFGAAEEAATGVTGVFAIAAKARRDIAAALGPPVTEERVHITVDATGSGGMLLKL